MPDDLSRYHRQMLLPGFGEAGQRKLLDSTVLVVGCGALGTVIANMLARAGVGHLVIVDRDFIEITNLQRQVLFDEDDVEAAIPKAEAARRKLAKINSQVKVTAVVDDVNHANIEKLAGVDNPDYAQVDLIIDGVDNFETRYLTNDLAVKHGIPYVYGGAVGTVGATYAILPHTQDADTPWERADAATPCLRCIFEQAPPPGVNPTCDTAGVIGPAVSIVANYQVLEGLKILTGNLDRVNPKMLHLDLWSNTIHQFKVAKAYDVGQCTCCKQRNFEFLDGKFGSSTTTLCGRNAVQLNLRGATSDDEADAGAQRGNSSTSPAASTASASPVTTNANGSTSEANGSATPERNGHKLDFSEIEQRLAKHGQVKSNKFMLRAQVNDNGSAYEITLFTDGRAIVKGTKHASTARSIYAKYVGA